MPRRQRGLASRAGWPAGLASAARHALQASRDVTDAQAMNSETAAIAFWNFAAASAPTIGRLLNTAIVATAISLTVNHFSKKRDGLRRCTDIAAALVFELRTYERLAKRLSTGNRPAFMKGIGFSRHLFEALLGEIPSLGGKEFLGVRAAYQQLTQVNYLVDAFQKPVETGLGHTLDARVKADRDREIGEAYERALSMALTRIKEALEALREVAPEEAFTTPLPEMTEATLEERAIFDAAGR